MGGSSETSGEDIVELRLVDLKYELLESANDEMPAGETAHAAPAKKERAWLRQRRMAPMLWGFMRRVHARYDSAANLDAVRAAALGKVVLTASLLYRYFCFVGSRYFE
jgi:hypothetical protein